MIRQLQKPINDYIVKITYLVKVRF